MEAFDVKCLKELEEESRRLKQSYVELSLNHKFLNDVIEKRCKASSVTRIGGLPQAGAWCKHPQSLPNRSHRRRCVSV